jgi:hypothetical protein
MSILLVTPANRATFGRTFDALKWARRVLLWAASGPLRLVNFWRTRSQLSALAAMSGYELRDIGLTSFDVANAMASSSAEDPTDALARVAQDRRFKRES